MNRDTKAQSGYYPFKEGLLGDFYYLFISGEGKNELKLPYTVRIESIEILVNGSEEEPIETGFSSVEYHDGTAKAEFYAPGGALLIAAYDADGRLLKTAVCQSSEWTKDGEMYSLLAA